MNTVPFCIAHVTVVILQLFKIICLELRSSTYLKNVKGIDQESLLFITYYGPILRLKGIQKKRSVGKKENLYFTHFSTEAEPVLIKNTKGGNLQREEGLGGWENKVKEQEVQTGGYKADTGT